uniref:Ras-associating domain-containing protein n=1 Tax=Ciona savignyi TaxID=51511 RepID=H2Z298_CIOSA
MTARNLCQMITRKFNIPQPEDYCLHVIVNDEAHPLEEKECPQLVKMDLLTQFPPTAFYFSFQRKTSVTNVEQGKTDLMQQDEQATVQNEDIDLDTFTGVEVIPRSQEELLQPNISEDPLQDEPFQSNPSEDPSENNPSQSSPLKDPPQDIQPPINPLTNPPQDDSFQSYPSEDLSQDNPSLSSPLNDPLQDIQP